MKFVVDEFGKVVDSKDKDNVDSNTSSDHFMGAIFLNGRDKCGDILSCMIDTVDTVGDLVSREGAGGSMRPQSITICDSMKTRSSVIADSPEKITSIADVGSLNYALCSVSKDLDKVSLQPSAGREYRTVLNGYYDTKVSLSKMFSAISGNAPIGDKVSFPIRIKNTIFDGLEGTYSVGVYILCDNPSFTLVSKGDVDPIVIQLVLTRTSLSVVWASDHKVMDAFKYTLANNAPESQPVFIESLVLSNSMIVLNPIHLSSKWKRGINRGISLKNPLVVLNILTRYLKLHRLPLNLPVEGIRDED